ncbi:MAG: NAD(P)H-dependent oxidoreductase [Gammaproteobacteria bacterium]|nr:NAD(P)H-dependent oxidoreductase [Gammaproteobacteria bacterium]
MAKILLMAASLRQDSCNKKLINLVAKLGIEQKIEIEQLDFADFIAPLYSGDIEEKNGLPEMVQTFIAKLKDADGLVIASPEYNFSTPGTLKNLLDWVSRARPMPWVKYPVMLCSASPALAGGSRGLLHTVATLQCACNAYIYPPMFSLGNAYEAFTSDGSLQDKELEKRLGKNILGFVDFVKKLR